MEIVGFVASLLASFLAVIISLYALTFQRRIEHETSTQTLIHAQYELCRVLDLLRVEHPEVSHVLALPTQSGSETWKQYHLFKRQVRCLVQDQGVITQASMARLYLQEHATTLHVCDIYEQTLYQRQLAVQAGDKRRCQVLDTLAQYYEERMLRNPRLRYHWDNGASDMMEASTRERYDEKVRKAYPNDPIDANSPLDETKETNVAVGEVEVK